MSVAAKMKTKCVTPPILSKAKHIYGGKLFWLLGAEIKLQEWVGESLERYFSRSMY
jgi:hypothetical protein